MIEQALSKVQEGIASQIKAISTGRGVASNASAFNELVKAKVSLEGMLPTKTTAKVSTLIKCEHCGEENTKAMHGRWHGDKCKKK